MHPLLTIAGVWVAVGLVSVLTAVVLHRLLPIGPYLAAGVALMVGLSVVFLGFLRLQNQTVRRDGG